MCKWLVKTRGDDVPYGSTTARLPDEIECVNDVADKTELEFCQCDESCKYYEEEYFLRW